MTEPVHTYSLRLLERFTVYVESGSNLFRDFPAGKIVTDRDTIKFLESRDAPVERINFHPDTRH